MTITRQDNTTLRSYESKPDGTWQNGTGIPGDHVAATHGDGGSNDSGIGLFFSVGVRQGPILPHAAIDPDQTIHWNVTPGLQPGHTDRSFNSVNFGVSKDPAFGALVQSDAQHIFLGVDVNPGAGVEYIWFKGLVTGRGATAQWTWENVAEVQPSITDNTEKYVANKMASAENAGQPNFYNGGHIPQNGEHYDFAMVQMTEDYDSPPDYNPLTGVLIDDPIAKIMQMEHIRLDYHF